MSSNSSQFDFTNEGDCILAGKQYDEDCLSSNAKDDDISWTLSFIDLLANMPDSVNFYPDIKITEDEASQLKKKKAEDSPMVKPFAEIIDLNNVGEVSAEEIKPKPSIAIGLKGEF